MAPSLGHVAYREFSSYSQRVANLRYRVVATLFRYNPHPPTHPNIQTPNHPTHNQHPTATTRPPDRPIYFAIEELPPAFTYFETFIIDLNRRCNTRRDLRKNRYLPRQRPKFPDGVHNGSIHLSCISTAMPCILRFSLYPVRRALT